MSDKGQEVTTPDFWKYGKNARFLAISDSFNSSIITCDNPYTDTEMMLSLAMIQMKKKMHICNRWWSMKNGVQEVDDKMGYL